MHCRNKSKLKYRFRSRSGLLIGVTGNICSGKTLISRIFEKLGFFIISSDAIVHDIFSENKEVYAQIKKLFPDVIRKKIIDRTLLGAKIFSNPELLKKIESIIYPEVTKIRKTLINDIKTKGNKSIVMEIPLLFEKDIKENFHYIISVIASKKTLQERALNRKGMTQNKFHAIYKNQFSNLVHIDKADFIIQNDGTKLSIINTIRKVIKNDRCKRGCIRYRDYRIRCKTRSQNNRNRLYRTYKQSKDW